MTALQPVVRYLIACEDVRPAPDDPQKLTLVNLISTIRSRREPPFPLRHPELCVYVQMTECRGEGEIQIRVVEADGDREVFHNPPRTVRFVGDPLDVMGASFRVKNCSFPHPGLYWIQFCYNGAVIARQPLLLR